MTKKMLIDATQAEETRVAIIDGNRLQAFDFDSANRKQLKGNLYLAKVTRVEPSLQACFVEYGGNRQGFLAFSEIHPDYYRIPVEDREALLAEEAASWDEDSHDDFGDDEFDAVGPIAKTTHKRPRHTSEGLDQPKLVMPYDPAMDSDFPMPAQAHDEFDHEDFDHDLSDAQSADINSQLMPDVDIHTETMASLEITETISPIDPKDITADIQQVEKDQTVETIGGDDEDSFEEQEQTARRHSKLRRRYKIQEVIKRRQILLVQVTKEERGNKGAALTSYISLPGRYCVLMPNSPRGGGISRKIANHQDRRRMRELLDELEVPQGMSVILRTAGMQRTKQEVKRDLDYLLRLWDEIRRTTLESVAPALIYEEADIFKRAVRDLYSSDTEEIIVAGPRESYLQVRDFMKLLIPSHARRVKHYADPVIPLFQRHQVETQIDQIYSPRVELRSGGYIIINPTEALVSIDVNSGRSTRERHIDDTALNTNLEAADEIARQLRLRDLGGLVVIDFIDMEQGRHNAKVERRMKDAMASDRARIEIGRVSPFGLLELSRQRLHPSLTETHFCPCPSCDGTGLVRTTESAAVVAIRMIEDEAIRGRAVQITASLPQMVAVYMLNHKRDALQKIDDYMGCRVAIHIDEEMMPNDIKIDIVKGTPQPKIKPPENLYVGSDDNEPELPLDEFEESGEPLFPHLAGNSDEGNVDQASYPRGERRGRGRRGGRGRYGERSSGSERSERGPRHNDRNGDMTIIPITQGDDGAPIHAEGDDSNAISAPPSFGRRRNNNNRNDRRGPRDNGNRDNSREPRAADAAQNGEQGQADVNGQNQGQAPGNNRRGGRERGGNERYGNRSRNNQNGSADQPMTQADLPMGEKPMPTKAPAPSTFPAKPAAAKATSAPQQNAPAPVANDSQDSNQPKKRGWWSKLVSTDAE